MRVLLLLKLVLSTLLLVGPWAAAMAAGAITDALISAPALVQQLGRPGLRVIDTRSPAAFRRQHIPGAVRSELFTLGPVDTPQAVIQAALRRWGVAEGDRLVLVDEGGSWEASRLYWDLLQAGLPAQAVQILDGGMAGWLAAGGRVHTEARTDAHAQVPPPAVAGSVRLGAPRPELQVQLPEFLAATADPSRYVMLEALDPAYYYGGAAFFSRGGHVPHATLMPSGDFFNADKTFKSPAELRRMLVHLGVRPEQEVLTYCGGGGAAAVPFFALKALLGHERVRMFTASQFGWLQDPRELPVWTYAQPALLRDTDWLKGWANPMLQRVGRVKTEVVDLRPADAFERGHVPLAKNLPIAQWLAQAQRHRHDAPALAQWLQAAGVAPDARVALVSEGGLTEDAALAFVLLEQAGHPQPSVWLDNLDR